MSSIKNGQFLKKDRLEKVGIFSSFLLFTVFSICLYSPVIGTHADQSAEINMSVEETLSLTLDKSTLNINVFAGGFAQGAVNANVTTNSQFGYSLTLEDEDTDTRLIHTDTNVDSSLSSTFEGTKTSSTMDDNTWGYSLDATDFSQIPAKNAADTLKQTNEMPENGTESTTVNFGAKTNMSLANGTYVDNVIFTAFTNGGGGGCQPGDNSFFCITQMQEMTPEVCAATVTPLANASEVTFENTGDNTKIPRTILTDSRDGTRYLVSKYADGQCWMSQNLELALSSSTALTSDTTDLNTISSWTPQYDTSTNINTITNFAPCYDNGDGTKSCGNADIVVDFRETSYLPTGNDKYRRGGTTPASSPSTDDGKSEWESVGIYYSWFAATAGTVKDTSATALLGQDSICPKGWKLPDSYALNYDTDEPGALDLFMRAYNDGYTDKSTWDWIENENFDPDYIGLGERFGLTSSGYIEPQNNFYRYETDPTTPAELVTPDMPIYWYNYSHDFYYRIADAYEISSNGIDAGNYFYAANAGLPVRCVAR